MPVAKGRAALGRPGGRFSARPAASVAEGAGAVSASPASLVSKSLALCTPEECGADAGLPLYWPFYGPEPFYKITGVISQPVPRTVTRP